MANRYQRLLLQCPQYDGLNPPGQEIPPRQEQVDYIQRQPGRWFTIPGHWRPTHCSFDELDAQGNPTGRAPLPGEGTWTTWDAQNKTPTEERYRCTRHGCHPVAWARYDAWSRRHREKTMARWKVERIIHPASGVGYNIYVPNRPEPRTLSNQWTTLAAPETRRRRRTG